MWVCRRKVLAPTPNINVPQDSTTTPFDYRHSMISRIPVVRADDRYFLRFSTFVLLFLQVVQRDVATQPKLPLMDLVSEPLELPAELPVALRLVSVQSMLLQGLRFRNASHSTDRQ